MADKTLKTRFQQAVHTEAEWTSLNPVLKAREFAYSSDKNFNFKVGDGSTTWVNLPYQGKSTDDIYQKDVKRFDENDGDIAHLVKSNSLEDTLVDLYSNSCNLIECGIKISVYGFTGSKWVEIPAPAMTKGELLQSDVGWAHYFSKIRYGGTDARYPTINIPYYKSIRLRLSSIGDTDIKTLLANSMQFGFFEETNDIGTYSVYITESFTESSRLPLITQQQASSHPILSSALKLILEKYPCPMTCCPLATQITGTGDCLIEIVKTSPNSGFKLAYFGIGGKVADPYSPSTPVDTDYCHNNVPYKTRYSPVDLVLVGNPSTEFGGAVVAPMVLGGSVYTSSMLAIGNYTFAELEDGTLYILGNTGSKESFQAFLNGDIGALT